MSTDLELSEGAVRQRRNLMVVSIILIFIHHADVSFGTELKLHGATLSVGKPDVIFSMLLLSLAYFLWRFYKYFYHDKAYAHLKGQYRNTVSEVQNREVSRQIFKQLPSGANSYSGDHRYDQIKKLDRTGGYYELAVDIPTGREDEQLNHVVEIHEKPILRKQYEAVAGFAFRGKILSDFYVPFALAIYAAVISIV